MNDTYYNSLLLSAEHFASMCNNRTEIDNIEHELISNSEKEKWVIANYVVICTGLGLFSLVVNFANLCVFAVQGLKNSINISLFCIAMSDMVRVISVEWMAVCWNLSTNPLNAPVMFNELLYLSAGWPAGCAHNISMLITAYITVERYLCTVLPLTIKKIITPRRTVAVIISIYIACFAYVVPEYAYVYFDWNFYPALNRTMLGLAFRSEFQDLKGLSFLIHAILVVSGLFSVSLFSVLLVAQLKRQTSWRKMHTRSEIQTEALTLRDRKSSVLIAVLAVVMALVDVPLVTLSLVQSFVKDFSAYGRQSNLFHVAWSFVFIGVVFQPSMNFVVCYKMSSKYRQTIGNICSCFYHSPKVNT
ncbi:growth hormone secretagogue receptor type 1 [Biomphalaria glabrata]|nr:growth hormone secretagogue receptor type 1-like [Biomphalaria glabrata]